MSIQIRARHPRDKHKQETTPSFCFFHEERISREREGIGRDRKE